MTSTCFLENSSANFYEGFNRTQATSFCHDISFDINIMTGYHPRDIIGAVSTALENMPVVVVTGMRQTGKTTFLCSQPELGNRSYVSFDDFAQLESAKSDPEGFIRCEQPLTIDEAHKCPEIFTAIKRAVDKRKISGQLLLSGSANFSVLKNITESLAGRSVYLAIHPFNRREIHRQTTSEPFIKKFFKNQNFGWKATGKSISPEEVARGSMPTVCLRQVKDPVIWFRGYEQTCLERDVRELSRIGDLSALRALLRLTSLRTGQLLSPSQLGRDAKLSAATTSGYLSLFEASFLLTRVQPYLGNKSSRLIKSPKLYLSDSGLTSYLTGLGLSTSMRNDPLYGAILETYVAQNLLSILRPTGKTHHCISGLYRVVTRLTSSSRRVGPVSRSKSSQRPGGKKRIWQV